MIPANIQKIESPINENIQFHKAPKMKKGVAIRKPKIIIIPEKRIPKNEPILDKIERLTRLGAIDSIGVS